MGHVGFHNAGRLGNWLYECSAAMGYALDHGMPFSAPSVPAFGRDEHWNPIYCKHLIDPTFDPSLPTITIDEKGYPFQTLPWKDEWREGHNVILNGFFQSPRYFERHKEAVLAAFGFPWEMRAGFVCCHVRLGDARKYPLKHKLLSKEYYEEQMSKFKGSKFIFFSDELEWCRQNFGHRRDCLFMAPFSISGPLSDSRPEVLDLISGSMCEHQIGSASTFSIWQALLNRNPNKRCIFPKQWMVPNWEGTTEETWKDVVPVGENWERV